MGKDLRGRELGKGIKQRKNGRYEGRYINAFGERKSIYSEDLNLLRKILTQKQYELDNHIMLIDESITVDEWYHKWYEAYKDGSIRYSSGIIYKAIYNKHIYPVFGNRRLINIKKIQVQQLIKNIHAAGYAWSTQEKVRRILSDMYARAIEDNYAKVNPTRGIRLYGKTDDHYKFLTRDEQSMFFETAAGTFYDNLFNVAVNTGLRSGELFALTWDDIDLDEKVIYVTKALNYYQGEEDDIKSFHIEDPKTESSNRTVPINDICEKYLKRQLVLKNMLSKRFPNDSPFSNLLFVTSRNTPINTSIFHEAIKKVVETRNETLDPLEKMDYFGGHTFRHTFATRCIEAGIKPKTLQQYLGHKKIEITMDLYVHVTDDTKKEEIGLLNVVNQSVKTQDYLEKEFRELSGKSGPQRQMGYKWGTNDAF